MDTCDYLGRVGYRLLMPVDSGPVDDEDDPELVAEAARCDSRAVCAMLLDSKPIPRAGDAVGAKWLGRIITWPDRVPDLKTWAGQQTLAKLIQSRQKAMGSAPIDDLFTFSALIKGASGLDKRSRPSGRDAGFSLNALGIAVMQRPALELLAIIGLEAVPLVSFGKRDCGFLHDGKAWRFTVEMGSGGYLASWGQMAEYEP